MRRGPVAAAVFALTPCVTVLAQGQAPLLQPGTRVRLTFPCALMSQPAAGEGRTRCGSDGKFVMLQADTITLSVAESTTSYRLTPMSRLEVSRGHRSHALAGAGAGLLLGAGITFVLLNGGGSTSLCDQSANQDAIGSGACIGLAALGGLAGAGLGGVIGGLVRTERWQDVSIERLRVSVAPQAGVTFGLAVAF